MYAEEPIELYRHVTSKGPVGVRVRYPSPVDLSALLSTGHLLATEKCPRPTLFEPEDGGSMFIRNPGIRLHDYTMSQPKTP
jgi:hypothetical protein